MRLLDGKIKIQKTEKKEGKKERVSGRESEWKEGKKKGKQIPHSLDVN